MRSILVVLVFGFLVSCAPTQTKESQPMLGEKWILTIGNSKTYQLTTTEVTTRGKEVFYNSATNDGRASLISLAGVKEDGSLSNVIAFVSKSKPASIRLRPEGINDEEGTFCIAPYSLERKRLEGFYFNGFFNRIGTFRSPADTDGQCTLERV